MRHSPTHQFGEPPQRPVAPALLRGATGKCPSCGTGKLFTSYLKVAETCSNCAEELHHHRSDDAPPYFVMFFVGHLIVGGVLALEQMYAPETWVHLIIWLPLALIMSLLLLPPVKGMLVALQWALRMHGFSSNQAPVDHTQPSKNNA